MPTKPRKPYATKANKPKERVPRTDVQKKKDKQRRREWSVLDRFANSLIYNNRSTLPYQIVSSAVLAALDLLFLRRLAAFRRPIIM